MAHNQFQFEKKIDAKIDKIGQELNAKIDGIMAALAPGMRMPVASPRTHVEAEGLEDPNRTGVAGIAVDTDIPLIERTAQVDVQTGAFKAKADMLAFMEEKVTIDVHSVAATMNEKPAPFAVYCNGQPCALMPGRQYTIARKFVEVLARCRPVHYANEEFEENGVKGVRWPSWRNPRFPFSVVQDTPRGMEWLRKIMASP